MKRENDIRPKTKTKSPPDALDAVDNLTGQDCEEPLNLKSQPHRQALGGSKRDATPSERDKASRKRKKTQARKFSKSPDEPSPALDERRETNTKQEPNASTPEKVSLSEPAQPNDIQPTVKRQMKDSSTRKALQQTARPRLVGRQSNQLRTEEARDKLSEEPVASERGALSLETPNKKQSKTRYTPEQHGDAHDDSADGSKHGMGASPDQDGGADTHKPEDTATDKEVTPRDQPGDTAKPDSSKDLKGKKPKTGKLQFSGDDTVPPDKKLTKAQGKLERSEGKLADARKNLPKKHSVRIEQTLNKKDKPTRKLRFEEEVKSQREHIKGPKITRPVKAAANTAINYGHKKIYQVEHENVGTQAAHKGEILAETAIRGGYRRHKTAPYRKVAKLERKTYKLQVQSAYQQALHDNPQLNTNPVSRMVQKQKIKRQYAKAAREAKRSGNMIANTVSAAGKVVSKAAGAIAKNPKVLALIALFALFIVLISTLFGSCSNMSSGVGSAILATSYLAEDTAIDSAELLYTEWETELQTQIGNVKAGYPGFDEYQYQIDDITHNPYELLAYLTAVYQDFTIADIQEALRQLFHEQYQLSFSETIETRYADPEDADGDGDLEPYEWRILTIKLTSRPFTSVIYPKMDAGQRQIYDFLMQSKGNRQYAQSPLDFNWLHYVSDYYGYRLHPGRMGEQDAERPTSPNTGALEYHKGIDIAIPTGTEIYSTHSGTVTSASYSTSYGYVVVVDNGSGLVTKYAHCDSLLVSTGQTVAAGDLIAKSGNTGDSTGPHLHFEIIKDGQYLNPLLFAITNDNGSGPVYGDPGTPMGDGSYAALIAEAEKHLGKPYVFDTAGPDTFDCSGYVCWVLNYSGVKPMGRTNAQGLYNMSTPVSSADAQPGDLVFFTGTYSTPNVVSHVGIYVGNGMMLHAGSPIQYTSINTSYWQGHFYSFGRVN